jgi:hypothetical protein
MLTSRCPKKEKMPGTGFRVCKPAPTFSPEIPLDPALFQLTAGDETEFTDAEFGLNQDSSNPWSALYVTIRRSCDNILPEKTFRQESQVERTTHAIVGRRSSWTL